MIRCALFVAIFLTGVFSQAAVWTETNSWSPAMEARFSEWVRQNWSVDFFARSSYNGRPNPYQGLRADCADTVYSMRIVFAYENRLPFVIQDPTSFGKTLSNRMSRWDGQNDTARIRGFLVYMFNIVSTKSVPNDTYPVAINKNTIRPGALILTTTANHHSWTIKNMLSVGVPHLVFNSTIGAGSGPMLQERQTWPNPEWVFEGNYTPAGNAGFRYWRPVSYINRPVWEVPGYSEEQYKIGLRGFTKYVQSRLASRSEGDDELMTRLTRNACQEYQSRVSSVNDGLRALARTSGCMSQADFDTYSTPSRDQRIFDALMALRRSYREIVDRNGGSQLSNENYRRLQNIFPYIKSSAAYERDNMDPRSIGNNSVCVVEYQPGKRADLAEFKRRLFKGWVSNNPNDSAAFRWGESRGPSSRARSCPSWDSWTPRL